MRSFVIGCDSRRPDGYLHVREILEAWRATNLAGELWGLRTGKSPLAIRDALRKVAGEEAGIVVIEIKPGSWWTCHNADSQGLEWLREEILA